MNDIKVTDDTMPRWVDAWTPWLVKQWLQHSPTQPGPMAENLHGFNINGHFYCSHCCGRLNGRGILLPRESVPMWKDYGQPGLDAKVGKDQVRQIFAPTAPVCAACSNCDHKFVDSNHCLKCGWKPL